MDDRARPALDRAWRAVVLWLPAALILGCIVYFDLLNRKGAGLERLNQGYYDKILHALAFGALTFSVARALLHSLPRQGPWAVPVAVALATTAFTIISETVQTRTLPGHDEAPHLIANLAGILVAVVLAGLGWSFRARRLARRERAAALATLARERSGEGSTPGPTR